jgi:hypothetical protein
MKFSKPAITRSLGDEPMVTLDALALTQRIGRISHVEKPVTSHGFALNVSTDLAAFDRVLPCGFQHEVASLARLGVVADVSAVGERCARALAAQLGRELVIDASVEPPRDAEIPIGAPVRAALDLLAEPLPA